MARGPLYQKQYKSQFSGHETFPLRYGWLKKAFDAVRALEGDPDNKNVFLGDDAIARFGVGKNMVSSMRHWSVVTGIIEEASEANSLKPTALGHLLFDEPSGLDPFMEHASTLWLLHWRLCGHPDKTTWFWVFNHYPNQTFERERLVEGLQKLAVECGWSRVSPATIKRDVECFVRTYASRFSRATNSHEDSFESPLTELPLIKAIGKRDGFQFVRGSRPSLGDAVFLYALLDFWGRFSKANTMSFETVCYEPGSPGRVFLLDENELTDRLMRIEEISQGALRWSETAGLKQVIREGDMTLDEALGILSQEYKFSEQQEVAS